MGKVADTAIAHRHRRRADELAAAAAQTVPDQEDVQRDRRVRAAIADVRGAVRAWRAAESAVASADERAAAAVRTLACHGFAQPAIAATCGVSLWTVRRLLALNKPTEAPFGVRHE